MWLKAPNISCRHGFSTRYGGISPAPFDSLNLGGSQDLPEHVRTNRVLALGDIELPVAALCLLKQVHGTQVRLAGPGLQEGDALVTKDKSLVLAVSIADCYPLLYHDAKNGVIAAVHAGWRGTVAGIAARALEEMLALGAEKTQIQVAIGQGICKDNFEVGLEVMEQFEKAGFPKQQAKQPTGGYIDLAACNKWLLMQQGIPEKHIWIMGRCTFEPQFFSYRRDSGVTGRMWGLISMHNN